MTEQELFERDYIIDDYGYLDYCDDELEKYFLEKEIKEEEDNSCWLFERPTRSYNLEDNYGEDSMP